MTPLFAAILVSQNKVFIEEILLQVFKYLNSKQT